MKLTSKGRYAVMAMADLAKNDNPRPVPLTEISLSDIGLKSSFFARSAIAITAYLPLLVNFIIQIIKFILKNMAYLYYPE